MFHLKPANLEVMVMFLVSLLLGALFAERYASESFHILGTSPQRLGNSVISPKVFKKTGDFDDKGCFTYTPNPNRNRTETITATELYRFLFGRPFTYEPNPLTKSKKIPV